MLLIALYYMKKLLCCFLIFALNGVHGSEPKECEIDATLQIEENVSIKHPDPLILRFTVFGTYKLIHQNGEESGPFEQSPRTVDIEVPGKTKDTFSEHDAKMAASKAMIKVHMDLLQEKLKPECEKNKCNEGN